MSCPAFHELLEWVQDGARRDVASVIGTHVSDGCPDCARRLRLLDELAPALGRPLPPRVPPALRAATLGRLAAAGAPSSRPLERVAGALRRTREYVAELLLLGPLPAAAAGMRGDGDAAHRVFTAGPYQVDVALVGAGSVMGQVSGDSEPMSELSGATCILFTSRFAAEAPLAADGGFRFEHLGPARYALMIDSRHARLLLPDVDLRDEADRPT